MSEQIYEQIAVAQKSKAFDDGQQYMAARLFFDQAGYLMGKPFRLTIDWPEGPPRSLDAIVEDRLRLEQRYAGE